MLERAKIYTNSAVPNYAVSALASGLCFLNTTISAAEGNVASFYLSLASGTMFAGLAANQFGWDHSLAIAADLAVKAKDTAGKLGVQAKDMAVSQYHSFFKPTKEEAETPVVTAANKTPETPVVTAASKTAEVAKDAAEAPKATRLRK